MVPIKPVLCLSLAVLDCCSAYAAQAPTFAEARRARRRGPPHDHSQPHGHVANHTAIVTGVDASRHGLLVNGSLTRTGAWPPVRVEPWIPKPQMVRAPSVYDLAGQKGLTTAQVDLVAIKSAPTITWEFPEVPSAAGAIEREMIGRKLIDPESIEQFGKINIFRRDEIWIDAAVHILREHKPNLLLFHVLSLNSTHHTYGPEDVSSMLAPRIASRRRETQPS